MVIAHRAGNSPEQIKATQYLVDAVELDIHRGRNGRIEVRHAKTLWPTRRLWDRWYLLPAATPVPTLDHVLDSVADETGLWFDLKGVRENVSTRIIDLAAEGCRPIMVSSKSWWLLDGITGHDNIRTFRSVGNRFELMMLRWMPTKARVDGTVIHRRFLTPSIIERLRSRGPIFAWGATDRASVEWLEEQGIAGVILDDLGLAST